MTTEYRTQRVSREIMLNEVAQVCGELAAHGTHKVAFCFGWDSNIPIEEMWKDELVPLDQVVEKLIRAENEGTIAIGRSDVFLRAKQFCLTLCHEGDLHAVGAGHLFRQLIQRWQAQGYEPYVVKPAPNPSSKRPTSSAA